MTLDEAISQLDQTLSTAFGAPNWRWHVRRHLSAAREALAAERIRSRDGWLAARAGSTDRTRHQLLARMSALATRILDSPDSESTYRETQRLLVDLQHYSQRLHDLLYDSVGLELGGSE